jgi:hypothetical protein
MKHRRGSATSLLVASALLLGCSVISERRAVSDAEAAIRLWLVLVDEGQYETAWHQAAPELQSRSTIENWAELVKSARPVGKLTRRTVATRTYLNRLGTGPEGRYVNLALQAFLEDGTTFGELTTMVESGGHWRVYGYRVVGARKAAP